MQYKILSGLERLSIGLNFVFLSQQSSDFNVITKEFYDKFPTGDGNIYLEYFVIVKYCLHFSKANFIS